ncbi:dephospho-CoA kinase [Arthrobacter sp. Hiyo8]|nr:dephospho-CoA kinase [Arthrobacter sp. Hiyo8]
MLKIGLTGGIASGKSLVSARLRELGAVLIDADALAREVVEPGTPGLADVVAEFGKDIVDAEGRLDRARLGAIVFAEPDRREALNAIIHPRVREKAAAMLATAKPGDIVVQDIPLLVETGQGSSFHLVLVVDAPDEERIRRMTEIRGMTAEDAVSRMAAQASREERLAAADIVLENSGTVEEVTELVETLWEERLVPFARNLAAAVRPHEPADLYCGRQTPTGRPRPGGCLPGSGGIPGGVGRRPHRFDVGTRPSCKRHHRPAGQCVLA